jgi:hypothetical protein
MLNCGVAISSRKAFDHVLAIIKHAINLKRFDVLPDVNCRS